MANFRRDKRPPKPVPPLSAERLEELAIRYVGRYATSRARLTRYLSRKLKERGWDGEGSPDLEALVARFADLGYVDDAGYAASKARSLANRGYGARRVSATLYADGIAEPDGREARDITAERTFEAALTFARKKRIGPYADEPAERPKREKQLQAMLRAGHGFALARRIAMAQPGEAIVDEDADQYDLDPDDDDVDA